MPRPLPRRPAPVLFVILLSFCLLLASCSPPETVDTSPTRLRVLMTDDWGDRPAFLAAVKEFEESHSGVRVEIQMLPISNMAEAVRAQLRAGEPADFVQWHAYAAGAQDLAEPLDDLWEEAGIQPSEFFPGAVADVEWDGQLYGVPLDINALVLFYRPDTFSEAGLDAPGEGSTFGDLERFGEGITSPDGSRRLIAIASSYWAAYGWVRANGGELVTVEEGRPRYTLDSPQVIETLEFLSGLVEKGYAFPPAGASSSADALALFRSGSAGMHASGSWDLAKLDRETIGATYGAAPMPRGTTGRTAGSVTGGSSLFVPRGSANRELAFELMMTVTSDRHALELARQERRLPVRPRVYSDSFFDDPALQVVLDQLETAHPLLIEAFPEAAAAWDAAFSDVMINGADPATALRAAQAVAEGPAAEPEE